MFSNIWQFNTKKKIVDIKGLIWIRKLKVDWLIDCLVFNANVNNSKSNDRQYNVQKKKDKRTLTEN